MKGSSLSPKMMNRKTRVRFIKSWHQSLKTKKIIKAYKEYFGVDKYCAAKELIMAGVELEEKHAKRWATHWERKKARKDKKKKELEGQKVLEQYLLDSNETFYFIVGHTSGGTPYGITWEEAKKEGLLKDDYFER